MPYDILRVELEHISAMRSVELAKQIQQIPKGKIEEVFGQHFQIQNVHISKILTVEPRHAKTQDKL